MLQYRENRSMRKGALSDVSIKKHCPEMFTLDYRAHQSMYEDFANKPKHGMKV